MYFQPQLTTGDHQILNSKTLIEKVAPLCVDINNFFLGIDRIDEQIPTSLVPCSNSASNKDPSEGSNVQTNVNNIDAYNDSNVQKNVSKESTLMMSKLSTSENKNQSIVKSK